MNLPIDEIVCGGCLEVMKDWQGNCIDTIICDPPYGLSFMGKKWDYDVPSVELWQECLRVLKSGGTLLCFAGSRTQHRMAVNVEDAGFILKDCIMWLYGSGFPKATDISKQLDKIIKRVDMFKPFAKHFKEQRNKKGLSHKDIASHFLSKTGGLTGCVWNWENASNVPTKVQWETLQPILDLSDEFVNLIDRMEAERKVIGKDGRTAKNSKFNLGIQEEWDLTSPATPEAQLWNGWKSHGLKPAYEPILVAMKPNDGTYANNALKHGVSGLNIDGSRIGTEAGWSYPNGRQGKGCFGKKSLESNLKTPMKSSRGRFPANVILDDEVTDEEWSRFFYCAKASKAERNAGCEGLPKGEPPASARSKPAEGRTAPLGEPRANHHPTIKPLALMEYLCTLTKTPMGGLVLDPFCGSGTTCIACVNTERDYIGIEKDPEYAEIAKCRIDSAKEKYGLFE